MDLADAAGAEQADRERRCRHPKSPSLKILVRVLVVGDGSGERVEVVDELGVYVVGDRHDVLGLRVGAARDVGDELAERAPRARLGAGRTRHRSRGIAWSGAASTNRCSRGCRSNRYWASPPVPAPIENRTSDVRLAISSVIRAGTTSISAANAPASSNALTCWYTSLAVSSVLPTALNPPVHVRRAGISPTCPTIGTPSCDSRSTIWVLARSSSSRHRCASHRGRRGGSRRWSATRRTGDPLGRTRRRPPHACRRPRSASRWRAHRCRPRRRRVPRSRFSMWTIVIWRLALLRADVGNSRARTVHGRRCLAQRRLVSGNSAERSLRRAPLLFIPLSSSHSLDGRARLAARPPDTESRSGAYAGIWPWTQTGMCSGIRFHAQIQSIAGTLTRTQPCEAG